MFTFIKVLSKTQLITCRIDNSKLGSTQQWMTLTCCQDHILTENIWFVWSETSYSGDERRCHRCGTKTISEDRATQPIEAGGWVSRWLWPFRFLKRNVISQNILLSKTCKTCSYPPKLKVNPTQGSVPLLHCRRRNVKGRDDYFDADGQLMVLAQQSGNKSLSSPLWHSLS